MSNYAIQVAWSGKDALADSDPAKVISGNDFNTEFSAVQTALNSKAELTGSNTQAFSATTATAGTSTTQVATTAFVGTAITAAVPTQSTINDYAYPVGSIYTSVVSTDPATLLGVGTWVAFGAGKVLVGLDAADTDFDTVESSTGSTGTGGTKTHTLTEDEMPAHNHKGNFMMESSSPSNDFASGTDTSVANPDGNVLDHTTVGTASKNNPIGSTTGSGNAHNNLQPYITVYFWKRTL